jgi:predicted nucleic acid-binding protein
VSPLPSRVVLDTTVLSSLHLANALAHVLGLWESQWVVPLQVRDEAAAWPSFGPGLVTLLDGLFARGTIEYASPNPGPEGALFAKLQRVRGQGESAAIAIACVRGFVVATDDRRAKRSCEGLHPPVAALATEELLTIAVGDGALTRAEAERIWIATGIQDPRRGIGR